MTPPPDPVGGEPICPSCGAGPRATVPVWENPGAYVTGDRPDYIGCTACETMHRVTTDDDADGDA